MEERFSAPRAQSWGCIASLPRTFYREVGLISDDDPMPRLQVRYYNGYMLLHEGNFINNEYFILVIFAGAACSALKELQQGVYLAGILEPTCVSSTTNSPIVLAAASSDTMYQMTDNINSLIQQQLSGGGLDPAWRGARSWPSGHFICQKQIKPVHCCPVQAITALSKQI